MYHLYAEPATSFYEFCSASDAFVSGESATRPPDHRAALAERKAGVLTRLGQAFNMWCYGADFAHIRQMYGSTRGSVADVPRVRLPPRPWVHGRAAHPKGAAVNSTPYAEHLPLELRPLMMPTQCTTFGRDTPRWGEKVKLERGSSRSSSRGHHRTKLAKKPLPDNLSVTVVDCAPLLCSPHSAAAKVLKELQARMPGMKDRDALRFKGQLPRKLRALLHKNAHEYGLCHGSFANYQGHRELMVWKKS